MALKKVKSLSRKMVAPAVAAVAMATAALPADAGEQLRWRVPVAFGTHLPALGDNINYVAETLNAATAGEVQFKVFEPGKLVAPLSITEAVKDGKMQAGYTWLGYDQGRIPSAPLLAARPFGMEHGNILHGGMKVAARPWAKPFMLNTGFTRFCVALLDQKQLVGSAMRSRPLRISMV